MNSVIKNGSDRSDVNIRVKVSRKTQKIDVSHVNEESQLLISNLGTNFGGDVGNYMRILLRLKVTHKRLFAYEIVRIPSLMVYSKFVEYNVVGDTKAPWLPCFPFIWKLKSSDTITTGPNKNSMTFSNLQFRRLLKLSFHSIKFGLSDTSGEKKHFVSVGLTRLNHMLRKVSDVQLWLNDIVKFVPQEM